MTRLSKALSSLPSTMDAAAYRVAEATALSEADWSETVRAEAAVARCKMAYHTFDSRRSAAGWPDWVFVTRDNHLLMVELKKQRGRLSMMQAETLDILSAAGVECHVFRPLDRETVVAVLNCWKPVPDGGWPTEWRNLRKSRIGGGA